MQHAPSRLVERYRIVVEREDLGFVASLVEMPSICERGATPDEAVEAVRATASIAVVPGMTEGTAPTPLRDSEGPLGAWADDLELTPLAAVGGADVERPSPETMRGMARATAERYRMILEAHDVHGFVGTSAELPDVVAHGPTAGATVQNLERRLVDAVYGLLEANRMPPEARRDAEARQVAEAGSVATAQPEAQQLKEAA